MQDLNPTIPIFLINLDRSTERLRDAVASAGKLGLSLSRISAVDGSALTDDQLKLLNIRKFHAINGRKVLPAEIGCFLSHIKALHTIAEGQALLGVVLEDDARLTVDFAPIVAALTAISDEWDIVKLINHRTKGFVRARQLGNGYSLGRCMHGFLGSTAAYIVTRQGARQLLSSISEITTPIDVEIERGWAHGVKFYTLNRPVVTLSGAPSTLLNDANSYRAAKFPFYRRWRTLLFRATNYIQRIFYAASLRLG